MKKEKIIYGPLHHEIDEEQKYIAFQKRFYSCASEFAQFKDLNLSIKTKIKSYLSLYFPIDKFPLSSSKRYNAILKFLINAKASKDFPTFDEKIIFLIEAIDPDLKIYFYFLTNGFSLSNDEKTKDERARDLISFIKKAIGAFDVQFLKYEELYFDKFLKNSSIISNVNRDYTTRFFASLKDIKGLETVNDFQFQFLLRKVDIFFANCNNPKNPNTVCYNLYNQNSILEIWAPIHRAIFFIQVIDPDLNILKIYNEECHISKVQERMLQEFGFYNEDIIKFEQAYQRKFFPGMRFDEWHLN